jgi:hypothetical protein
VVRLHLIPPIKENNMNEIEIEMFVDYDEDGNFDEKKVLDEINKKISSKLEADYWANEELKRQKLNGNWEQEWER